jgi:hypothetical protein
MLRKGVALAVVALVLAGCGGRAPGAAAESASRLLAAAMKGDRVAFEAEIDRRAVREDLRRQMVELAQQSGIEVAGGPSDLALDRMIGPDAIRVVTAGAHERLAKPPTPDQLDELLKQISKKKVCLRDIEAEDRCLLTFAKAENRWRLVGMQATDLTIAVAGD